MDRRWQKLRRAFVLLVVYSTLWGWVWAQTEAGSPTSLAQQGKRDAAVESGVSDGLRQNRSLKEEAPRTGFRGEEHLLTRLEFNGAKVVDAIRLIAEISGVNIVATAEAGSQEVTLFLQNITAAQAVESVCKISGLWYRRDEDTQTFRVMTTEEFQKDYIVYRKDQIQIFTLQHPNSLTVATAIEDLFGDRVFLSLGIDETELDELSGMGSSQYGGTFGAGRGLGGGAYGQSSFGATGRYSRTGSNSTGRFSRGVGGGARSGYGGTGRRGARARDIDSEAVVQEELTPDQLAMLGERLGEEGRAEGEILEGISRKDPPIYISVNRQHNLIVVRTSDADTMKEIERLIAELDRPTPQVLLEMKILELTVGDSFRSVFDMEVTTGHETSGPATTQPANPLLPSAATAPRHTFGSGNFPLEGGTLVYQYLSDAVRARMELLQRDNRIEVVATPLLLASNNRVARMFVGEERVLTTGVSTDIITPDTGATTAFVEPITEVRDVGNTLIIVPKINADRTVTLFINQDSSSVHEDGATIPVVDASGTISEFAIDTINTATLQATVVAKDGRTLAIGGLIRVEQVDVEEKVPFLGDLPLLGFFFRREERANIKSELILLITPHVLFTPAEAEAATEQRLKELSRHRYLENEEGDRDRATEPLFDEVEERLDR